MSIKYKIIKTTALIVISFGAGYGLNEYLDKDDQGKNINILENKEKQVFSEKDIIINNINSIKKIVSTEIEGEKEYEYKDYEFYFEKSNINEDSGYIKKVINKTGNAIKNGINELGERSYKQKSIYTASYGVDLKNNKLEIIDINLEKNVVKIKKPKIELLFLEVPYDELELEIEDESNILQGKLKIVKNFSDKEKQMIYKEFYDKLKEELENEANEKYNEKILNDVKELIQEVNPNTKIIFE